MGIVQRAAIVMTLQAALGAAGSLVVCAQPIFTTAPVHLQKVVPEAQQPKRQPVRPADSKPASGAKMVTPLLTAPGMLPIPGFAAPSVAREQQKAGFAKPAAATAQAGKPVPAPATGSAAPAAKGPRTGNAPAANGVSAANPATSRGANAGPIEIVRHLTNNIQGFRLAGEIAALEWPVYFTHAQTRTKLQFKVGYLSAVSVMPEASRLKLVINDTIVGIANIQPTRGSRTILFDIPPGLIKPGFNSLRLTAEQRHRVDCSIEATYELWTQLDPTRTGFVLPSSDPGVTKLADIAALPPDEQGAVPIRIVSPPKTTTRDIERVMRAVQRIALLGRFEQPVVDLGNLDGGDYGINLVIGTIDDIAGIARELNIGTVAGPLVKLTPSRRGLRTTIVVTGRSDADLDFALMQIVPNKIIPGSKAGLRAIGAYPGYRIQGGQRVKLRDMGMASEEFSGRLYRAAFNVIMPPDFYAADYGKAYLDLAGGYAPGLSNASQIVVSVNGRNAVSMKLPKSSGDVFTQSPIPLRLGHLRPGLNRIEIEAQVPTAKDQSCDPLAAIGGSNRFLLLDTTEFVLPQIARIARAPDLAVTTTGGFPFNGGRKRPILFVPHADRHALAAAATVSAHLALAADQVLDFRFTTKRPENGAGATLVVAPHTTIDSSFALAMGLNPKRLHEIWKDRIGDKPDSMRHEALSKWEKIARERLILQRNFPAACHMRQPVGGYKTAFMMDMTPVAALEKDGADERDLFAEWDKRIRSQSKIMGYVSGFVKGVSDWMQGKVSVAKIWIDTQLENEAGKDVVGKDASLIVAQNIIGESSNDIWTLIIAPNTGLLSQAVNCLVDPRVWQQVSGRVAILNASEASVGVIPVTDAHLIATQPFSIHNIRLIVAGWFSLNSKIYVLCAFLMALLLAMATNWFVRNAGRKT